MVWIVVGIVFGIALGIAVVIAGGIAGGIAVGIARGIAAAIAAGIAVAIAVGIALGIWFGIVFGIALGIWFGIVFGIALGISGGIALGIAFGIAFGIAVWEIASGIAIGIAVGIASTRAYYLVAHPFFVWPQLRGDRYTLHPVAWDDLCSIPFPGLCRLLADYARFDRPAAEAEIERLIDTYPTQRHEALKARTLLIAEDSRSVRCPGSIWRCNRSPRARKAFCARCRGSSCRSQPLRSYSGGSTRLMSQPSASRSPPSWCARSATFMDG